MSLPIIPRHQLHAQEVKAVLATAAIANWRHDFSGRAQREAVNDCPAGRIAVPSAACDLSILVADAFLKSPVPRREARQDNPAARAGDDEGKPQTGVELGA